MTNGHEHNHAKFLLVADKGKEEEQQEQSSIRNRLKTSNYNINKKDSCPRPLLGDENENPKYYHTEKFGQNLLMNSDSNTAIAANKLIADENHGHQFYVGEVNVTGENVKRII